MTTTAVKNADDTWGILGTAVVPWNRDGEFDEGCFRQLVATLAKGLTKQLYIFGTAGEGYAVSDQQYARISQTFLGACREHRAEPMIGIISLSLPTIQGRIEQGRDLGCRTFQLSLPAWGVLNDVELDRFFAETCGRFPDCEFHHYNLRRSGRLLTSVEYRRVADAHSNLVGVKASTRDPAVVADLLTMSPRLKFFFTEFGYELARRITPQVGLLISLAAVDFAFARDFVSADAFRRKQMLPALEFLSGGIREIAAGGMHIDGAFDKMIARCALPEFPLRLLPPYVGATDADYEKFRTFLPSARG
ncbi:dihydrodipicolinate synthase family protein [Actomonas aquatica]|uniref:Dihydrodipicolinate synthase family protein n=1 Tax=Actomonas aquatica TaxID=2866162 RepID=A0ABZ1CHQ1_9BACT|nr:dihydrodipicolinate synthase family protein [Opitutus sp. WL0086]WRQ90114.1 dihydrodipicolinate synthase family protein [Opitutus sp. WL0086]